jgi:hypothetical protein
MYSGLTDRLGVSRESGKGHHMIDVRSLATKKVSREWRACFCETS